ncbi:MAG: energy transducer TonB [Desulfovibrio sp.]|nr:energy transducer TonB [Desulfovibrio sp.]MBI4961267.1 energy transducer TonB [Desulfovibrio sp.]
MRPAELFEHSWENPGPRRAEKLLLGAGVSVVVHCAAILIGLAVLNISGHEGGVAAGRGGEAGPGFMVVDLGTLPGLASLQGGTGHAGIDGPVRTDKNAPTETDKKVRRASPDANGKAAVTKTSEQPAILHEKSAPPDRKQPPPRANETQSAASGENAVPGKQDGASSGAEASGRPEGGGQSGPGQGNGAQAAGSGQIGQGGAGTGSGSGEGGVLSLVDVENKPRLIKHVEPDYPEGARKRAISGKVVARFIVDEAGMVHNPVVSSSDPPGIFEVCVLEAVKRWKFEPGRHRGQPVRVLVSVPVRFDIAKR